MGVVRQSLFKLIGDGKQDSLWPSLQCSILQMRVRAETEEWPWKYMFSSEDNKGDRVRKLYENRSLRGSLKTLLSDSCSRRTQGSQDKLFDMLGYRKC